VEVFERAVTEGINNELNKKSEPFKLPKKTANTEERYHLYEMKHFVEEHVADATADADEMGLEDAEVEVKEMELEVLKDQCLKQMAKVLNKKAEELKQANKTTNREKVSKEDQKQMLAYHL